MPVNVHRGGWERLLKRRQMVAVAALVAAFPVWAQQCLYCAISQHWSFPEAVESARYRMLVAQDSVTVFFAAQFNRGYVGLQTLWRPGEKRVIFSIWNATDAVATDPRAYCQRFRGEGVGWSCRSDAFPWQAGVEYAFDVSRTPQGRWRASIEGSGDSLIIGEIEGSETHLTSTANFVEQWGVFSCQGAPTSSAVFYPPILNLEEEKEVRLGPSFVGKAGICQRGASAPYDGGAFVRFGGQDEFTQADRALLDQLLPLGDDYRPLFRRAWTRAWMQGRALTSPP